MDYSTLLLEAKGLLEAETHPLAALSNLAALIYERLPDLNWAGFYLMEGGSLLLGPFQGKVACIRIPIGRGVCGTAAAENRVIRVENVHDFPGHIACDSASNSEIVLPLSQCDSQSRPTCSDKGEQSHDHMPMPVSTEPFPQCDSQSRPTCSDKGEQSHDHMPMPVSSEPFSQCGCLVGVLDIDSPLLNRFTAEDEAGLTALAHLIESTVDWNRWTL